MKLAGAVGVEPTSKLLESPIIPLYYTPMKLVRAEGIEPPTYAGYVVYSHTLPMDATHGFEIGGNGRTRTFEARRRQIYSLLQ